MVKSWHTGYNNLSNIVSSIEKPTQQGDFNRHITATLEQQGLLASQAAPYISTANAAAGSAGVGNVLAMSAGGFATAQDRGDSWGASTTMGGDQGVGKSFLQDVASGKIKLSGNVGEQVDQLYKLGFEREADREGLMHHMGAIQYGGGSIQKTAQAFLDSDEAGVKDNYHEYFGRNTDDRGLQYWMDPNSRPEGMSATEFTKELLKSGNTYEGQVRKSGATNLGQFSNKAERDAYLAESGFFTDMQEGGYDDLDWGGVTKAGAGKGVVEQAGTKTGVAYYVANQDKDYEADYKARAASMQAAANQQTVAGPKFMPTIHDIQQGFTAPGDDWSLIKSDAEKKKKKVIIKGTNDGETNIVNTGDTTTGTGDWDDPIIEDTDSTFDPTPKDYSGYQNQKNLFDDSAAGISTPGDDMSIRSSQYMKTGAHAKGVRLKRSEKFKSGQSALGTKQFSRQLQIKSLNI